MKLFPRVLLIMGLSCVLCSQGFAFSFGLDTTQTAPKGALSPDQVQQVKQIIGSYFVEHPTALVRAFEALQTHQMHEQQKRAKKVITKNANDLFESPDSPVMGNFKGDVTVVEFMDYRCAHCKDMGPIIKKLLDTDKNIRVVIKQLPIFGEASEYAAKAALAANKQGYFRAMHERMLAVKDAPLNKILIMKFAHDLGLNIQQMDRDINSPAIENQIKDNVHLAQMLSIMGTPAFIIGNSSTSKPIYIPGAMPLQAMQHIIATFRENNKKD